jgi:hypothetical protein
MSTPASPLGGMDLRSEIAADLSTDSAPLQGEGQSAESTSSIPASASTGQTAPGAASVPTEAPTPEPKGEPTPQQDEEFTLDLDKEPDAPETPAEEPAEGAEPDGKPADPDAEIGALLATTRGKRIYSAFKKEQALARLPEEGGIGHSPTVEQVKDYYTAYTDTQAMLHDFGSRSPEAADRFLQHWFGADKDGRLREGVDVVAGKLADALANSNPNLYKAAAVPFLQRYAGAAISRFMEQVESATEPAERERYYNAAQLLHHDLYGKYFDPKTLRNGTVAAQPQNAPDDALRAENERLKAQLTQRDTETQQRTRTEYLKQVETRTDAALSADVDAALAAVKDTMKPKVYDALKDRFVRDVKALTEKNREGMRLLQIARERAARSGDDAQVGSLVKQWRQMAVNHIYNLRKEYIEAAGQEVKKSSDQKHAQLQQSAQKVAPAASGAPVKQDLRSALAERKPGESFDEWMRRDMRS